MPSLQTGMGRTSRAISDEGQYPCSKQLQLLFLHNEGTICQFYKLAWAGLAVPISDEGQYPCSKQLQLLFLHNETEETVTAVALNTDIVLHH